MGLEAGSQLKSQGKWLDVGGTFLWDFTYLCWNLTTIGQVGNSAPDPISDFARSLGMSRTTRVRLLRRLR